MVYISWNEKNCTNKCDLSSCDGNIAEATELDLVGCELNQLSPLRKINYLKKIQIDKGIGEWKQSGDQEYLYIKADDHYWLGFLEGLLLKNQIKRLKLGIDLGALREGLFKDYSHLAKEYTQIPKEYKKEMEGMVNALNESDKTKWTYDDILKQNTIIDISYGHINPDKAKKNIFQKIFNWGCTSFGIKNKDGSIITGQNFDLNPTAKKALSFVHHKVGNKSEVFSMRMGASLSAPIGKNEHGVTSTVNVVKTKVKGDFGIPLGIKSRKAFENSETASEFVDIMSKGKDNASGNLIVTDKEKIISVQSIPTDLKKTEIKDKGYIVHSNRFLDEEWNQKYLLEKNYSLNRQKRAEKEVSKLSDTIVTNNDLLNILKLKDREKWKHNSEICRTKGTSQTIAFFTNESFGVGTPYDGIGKNPL